MVRTSWITTGHLAVLGGFAIGQPLYNLLARNPEFFVAHHSVAIDIWCFIFLVSAVPALLISAVELLIEQFSISLSRLFHALSIAVFTILIVLYFLRSIAQVTSPVSIVSAIIIGTIISTLYVRSVGLRLFFTAMLPSILVFPALFVFLSPVNELLFLKPNVSIEPFNSKAKSPVVVLVFDELPVTSLMNEYQNIDSHLYPNFAALAKDATWYRNATAVASDTMIAVPAILSGLYPDQFRLPTLANYPNNLFTLFANSHDLNVHEQYTMMSPTTIAQSTSSQSFISRMGRLVSDLSIVYLHEIVPEDLESNLPSITEGWTDFGTKGNLQTSTASTASLVDEEQALKSFKGEVRDWNQNRDQQFLEWVDSIVPTPTPTFAFFHSILPHVPWQFLPSGKRYAPDGNAPITGLTKGRWDKAPFFSTQAYQRHLLQLGFADMLLGKLIEQLKLTGLYDQSLLVITADHGASFMPGSPRRVATAGNYYDIMPVPLLIKSPDQRDGAVNDINIETVDILPTVIDILGIETNWNLDGRSAKSLTSEPRIDKTIYSSRGRDKLSFKATSLNAKYDTLERKVSLFGFDKGTGSIYKIGPYPEIVGRNVHGFTIASKAELDIVLNEPELFENVIPGSGFIPAYISGLIRSTSNRVPEYLAVSVNDKIQAVTRPWGSGTYQWIAIVDEKSFVSGKNEINVFGIAEIEDELILQASSTQTIETFGALITEDDKTLFSLQTANQRSILFNKNIRVTDTKTTVQRPLVLKAIASGPLFLLPTVEYPELGVAVTIDITVPEDSKLGVFFQTKTQPKYTSENQVSQVTKKGRNLLLLTVRSSELAGRLRIDPGAGIGDYIIHDLNVRALEDGQ